jgi:hypothetical protein
MDNEHNNPSPCPNCAGPRAHGQAYCKPCRAAYLRARRLLGLHQYDGNAITTKRRKDAKEQALAAKGNRCNRCGWTTDNPLHYGVYHFHHPERDRTIRTIGFGGRNMAKVLKELERCELLCSNCHVIEHAGEPGNKPGRPRKAIDALTKGWIDRMSREISSSK